MKRYLGSPTAGGVRVTIVDDGHPRHLDLPTQAGLPDLAWGILGDYLGRPPEPALFSLFKCHFVDPLDPYTPWTITATEIAAWLELGRTEAPD